MGSVRTLNPAFEFDVIPNVLRVVPRRIKRLIVLCSIAGDYIKDGSQYQKIIKKVNTVFRLAREDSALDLPFRMHSRVWVDQSPTEINAAVTFYLDKMPDYLEYGSKLLMKSEIRLLLEQLQQ